MEEINNLGGNFTTTEAETRHIVWTLEKVGDKYVVQDAAFQIEADSTTG